MQIVVEAIDRLYGVAHNSLKERVSEGGKISAKKLDQAQVAAHGLAYLKTELEACRQLLAWSERVGGAFGGGGQLPCGPPGGWGAGGGGVGWEGDRCGVRSGSDRGQTPSP